VGTASKHLANIRALISDFAEEAGLRDPSSFAHSFHILMKGSIVAAAEGDVEAAQRAKAMARLVLAEHSR
jgi:AraC-like DNA-binding protein